MTSIDIEGGKYTFVQRPGGGCEFLRHGEPWLEIGAGAKAIIAMANELEERRKQDEPTALERIARGINNQGGYVPASEGGEPRQPPSGK